ncbi:hypothetical protein [Candidatus Rhabdochlamydia porcellionis]|nr:hypothetical protein [Candidatus Rhabdochlamydia porcellionis]
MLDRFKQDPAFAASLQAAGVGVDLSICIRLVIIEEYKYLN